MRRLLPIILCVTLVLGALGAPSASARATLRFTTAPPAATPSPRATFRWNVFPARSAVTRYRCTWAGRTTPCTSPRSFSRLRDGRHAFTVSARRGSERATRTYAWVVDRIAPTAPTLTGTNASWHSTAATIRAARSADALAGVRGYEWQSSRDDGATWSRATLGAAATITADGTWLVRMRALDRAGNRSSWRTRTVRVDSSAPTSPTITGAPAMWTTAPAATLTAHASDTHSGVARMAWETSRDGGTTWQPFASDAATMQVSSDGVTLVRAAAVNGAGLRSSASAATPVRIDRTAPAAPELSGATGAAWADDSVWLIPTADDGGGSGVVRTEISASRDGGSTWSAWSDEVPGVAIAFGPAPIYVHAPGTTLLRARSVDAVGNVSTSSDAVTVRIDESDPAWTDVGSFDEAWTAAATVTATAVGIDDVGITGYWYRTLVNDAWTTAQPAPGGVVTITDEGVASVQVQAVDAAGKTTGWASMGGALIDRTSPPAPGIAGGTDGSWSTEPVDVAIVELEAAATDEAPYEATQATISTDAGATWSDWTTTPNWGSLTVTGTGTTLVRLRVVDEAGNIGAASATEQVQIDPTAPGIPISTGGAGEWSNAAMRTVTATPGTGGAGAAYEYRTYVGGSETPTGTVAGDSVVVSAEGETRVEFRAQDALGRWGLWGSTWPGSYVRLDRQAPTIEFDPVPSPLSGTYRFVAFFIVNDGQSSLDDWSLTLDGPVTTTVCSSSSPGHNRSPGVYCDFNTIAVPDGTYTLELAGGDLAGNPAVGSIAVQVDNSP